MISDPAAAALGLMVSSAADMYASDPTDLAPALDVRLARDWELLGHLTARDAVFRKGPMGLGFTVFYGFLARSIQDPGRHVAVIRGTGNLVEWFEDAIFISKPHPIAGHVESGFADVYDSMQYAHLGAVPGSLVSGIATAVGSGLLTVVGHSLGSALATYLTFDLAYVLTDRADGCFLASPHAGDSVFAAAFDAKVKQYKLINRVLDAVPHVPIGLGYEHPVRVRWVWPHEEQVRVKSGIGCGHHVLVYSAVLDKDSAWDSPSPLDKPMAACVIGVNA
jgi:triacylglycerol lipase